MQHRDEVLMKHVLDSAAFTLRMGARPPGILTFGATDARASASSIIASGNGPIMFVDLHEEGGGIAAIVHQQPTALPDEHVGVVFMNNQLIYIADRPATRC